MITENDVRKGLPNVIQDACELMLKDELFQNVLGELQKAPNYLLAVYLEEWRHVESRKFLIGVFNRESFYGCNFGHEKEEDFLNRMKRQSPDLAIFRKQFWEISRNIVKFLTESYASEVYPDFWDYWDKYEHQQSSSTQKKNQEKPVLSDEDLQKIDWESLSASLMNIQIPVEHEITELGFEKIRQALTYWEGFSDEEGNMRWDHYNYYVEFHGICLDKKTNPQISANW